MAKKVSYKKGLSEAIKAAQSQVKRPLFVASNRRSIPMRHQALGELFSGPEKPGLPTGCFIEIVGQPHAGKTSLTFALIDAVINQDDDPIHRIQTDNGVEHVPPPKRVLFIDFEQAVDLGYLANAGRNVVLAETDDNGKLTNMNDANVFVHQPITLEEGCDLMLHMIQSQEFGLVVMDSIAAMLSQEEAEKSMSANTVGKQARAIGMFLRKSAPFVNKYGVTVALINQWREKVGVSFGDPRTTPGGKAPGFYDAIKIDVMGPKTTPWFANGKTVKIKTMKNKVTGKLGEVLYHLETGHGISAEVELTEMAIAAGLVSFTSYKRPVKLRTKSGERKFKNVAEWIEYLRTHPKSFDQILRACQRKGIMSNKNISESDSWE